MAGAGQPERAEIYTYDAPWVIYGMNWSVRRDKPFRLAVGSFIEEYSNTVEVIQLDTDTGKFRTDPKLRFPHPYPTTKIMFVPDKEGVHEDLLATTGDYLRLWRIGDEGIELKAVLNNSSESEFCAPLTSFDWCEDDPKRVGTASIDTTCTIWDVEREVVDTQLVAHDKEVYDISFNRGTDIFASVSADGSVRMFDLRDKEHSTIIYESSNPKTPLLRVGWNKNDSNYLATILMDSTKLVILDIRVPSVPVAELQRHRGGVNALAWAPHSNWHICSVGDDRQALIWDVSSVRDHPNVDQDPILSYTAGAEINQLQWSSAHLDWVSICFGTKLQILRV